MMKKKFFIGTLCLMLASVSLYAEAQSGSSAKRIAASTAQEIAIGQQIHETILSSFYPYTDPKVVHYVSELGHSLSQYSERQDLPYQFTILYSDKIYATSSPGGYVYVTTGLLFFLENEAQLAAVLAHEIGELQQKDPKNSKARKTLDAITKGGTMVGPAFGQIGALAALGLAAINNVSQSKAASAPVRKLMSADRLALEYMVKAKQDPQGMSDLFYKFLNADKEITPYFYHYYQSRPITEDRFKAFNKAFSELSLEGKSLTTNPELYQEMTRGVREIYKQG